MEKKTSAIYKVMKRILKTAYPKIHLEGTEYLKDGPSIIVGNHTQMHGPIVCEFYIPGEHYTWCAGEMMHLKDVPTYAYKDFWSEKSKYSRPFYKLASYLIAPLSTFIFNNANTIGVYHDSRILSTFRDTLKKLEDGANIIIFPEHNIPYNHIVYEFQNKFVDIAKLYYKKTGLKLTFAPLYIAPNLKKMYLGPPIQFCPENPMEEERKRICKYLMTQITEIACALPEHTVVPYKNIPKKNYPSNKILEKNHHENTCC